MSHILRTAQTIYPPDAKVGRSIEILQQNQSRGNLKDTQRYASVLAAAAN